MKIYTQTYDLAKASPHRFWVAPYSEFKIGIKLLEKDEISDKDFTLKAGSVEFTPDEDKIDNFTLFTIKSNDTGFVEYTIEVEGVAEKLKLMQIVTDSTVFEIDASGGDVPADVATQTWVNSQISDFVEEDALTAYVPLSGNVNMTGSLSVSNDSNGVYLDSSNGVTVWDTDEGKQKIVSLDYDGLFVKGYNDVTANEIEYPTKSGTMVVDADLTAYYTKSETSSATELAEAFAGAGGGITLEDAFYNKICLPQTIFQLSDDTLSAVNLVGDEEFIVTDAKYIIAGTNLSSYNITRKRYSSNSPKLYGVVIPNTIKNFKRSFLNSLLSGAHVVIPDSVEDVTYFLRNTTLGTIGTKYIDFGNTRTTIPVYEHSQYLGVHEYAQFYVPDNLYDSWIAASGWSNISDKIYRHSELEAPYLYSSKVTGGAETGTTGTPAAVNAVKSVYETDWQTLSASADANTFYVVIPDPA